MRVVEPPFFSTLALGVFGAFGAESLAGLVILGAAFFDGLLLGLALAGFSRLVRLGGFLVGGALSGHEATRLVEQRLLLDDGLVGGLLLGPPLREVEVDELDDRLLGGVTLALPELEDPRVAARTRREARGDLVEEALGRVLRHVAQGEAAGMEPPLFPSVTSFSARGRSSLALEMVVWIRSWRKREVS